MSWHFTTIDLVRFELRRIPVHIVRIDSADEEWNKGRTGHFLFVNLNEEDIMKIRSKDF